MAENDETPVIKVTDRRRAGREEPASEPAPEPTPPAEAKPDTSKLPSPPLDFTTFILSLGTSALVQMGAAPDPATGEKKKELLFAKETVDLLGMLRDKTRGNLTPDEQRFFDALLYDVRMQFVEASRTP